MTKRAAVLGAATLVALTACGHGYGSVHAKLRSSVPALPVTTTGGLSQGAQATFGETSALVESTTPVSGRTDLRASALKEAIALSAAGARFEGPVAMRVRSQADAVAGGSAKVVDVPAPAGVAGAAPSIFAGSDEPVALAIAAESHGRPWRAWCATATGENAVRAARRSLTCALVRTDAHAPTTWHLSIETVRGTSPESRGWLRREPVREGDEAVAVARPDTRAGRQDAAAMSSFTFQKGGTALADLQVGASGDPPRVWLSRDEDDREEREAVEVTAGILSLVPWAPQDEVGAAVTR